MVDLEKAIEKGTKRMIWFCSIWTLIGGLPLIILSPTMPQSEFGIWQLAVIGWLIWVIVGVYISPKFVIKFWKD